MTRLPRAIRLDSSDLSVFEAAAEPGEWAVPGSVSFLADGPQTLTGKRRAAFANGFLGTGSFGWTTLVTVQEATEAEVAQVVAALTAHFLIAHAAPSAAEAASVAIREVQFAESLCDHPLGTMIAISRRFEGDELVEQFKTITPEHQAPNITHTPIDLLQLARTHG